MEVINEKQRKFAINFILYIIAFCCLIFIGINRTLAYTYTDIGDQANITVVLISTAYGSQPYNVPKDSAYNFNQVLQVDYLINNYNFDANKHYQLETHLTNQTFTNANSYSVTGLNGESCLIDYSASVFTGAYPRWDFQCPHATSSITLSIKNSSNQYLWDNGIYTWTSALLKYSTTSISSGSTDTDAIINNNNQNTNNIINNQNQNTQDIINNNNQNTQDIIESNKVCTTYNDLNIVFNGHLNSTTGETQSSSGNGVTDFIDITNADISITKSTTANVYACFYYDDKSVQSCFNMNGLSGDINIPNVSDLKYLRFTIKKSSNTPNVKVCKNGNQVVNDTLKDDDIGDSTQDAADFITGFSTDTFGLTSIVTAPLNLIQSLSSSSCISLHLPLPYLDNKYLDLPCMTSIYENYFGTFFTMYQTITYGIIAYWVIVRIFNQVKDFKNPEHDEIEVLDL